MGEKNGELAMGASNHLELKKSKGYGNKAEQGGMI